MQYDYHREEAKTNILSKMRCGPGEVWNETLQQCLSYGGGQTLKDKKPTPDQAISTEAGSRKTPAPPAMPQAGSL